MHHSEDQIVASDGVSLYWRAWEPENSPKATVCLVHGLGEHTGRYTHVAQAFTDAGLSLHAIDLRGHGRSSGARGHTPSYQQWLRDVDRMLERADVERPCFLYGHSLGGLLGISYGLFRESHVRGVISTGPALRRSFEVPAIKIILGKAMSSIWPTFAQHSGLNPYDLSQDPSIVKAYIEDPLVHDWATARLFVEATAAGEQALERAADFTLPVLLIVAEHDKLIDPAAVEQFYNAAGSLDKTFHLWPASFHEVHNEPHKAQVLSEISAWILNRCEI